MNRVPAFLRCLLSLVLVFAGWSARAARPDCAPVQAAKPACEMPCCHGHSMVSAMASGDCGQSVASLSRGASLASCACEMAPRPASTRAEHREATAADPAAIVAAVPAFSWPLALADLAGTVAIDAGPPLDRFYPPVLGRAPPVL